MADKTAKPRFHLTWPEARWVAAKSLPIAGGLLLLYGIPLALIFGLGWFLDTGPGTGWDDAILKWVGGMWRAIPLALRWCLIFAMAFFVARRPLAAVVDFLGTIFTGFGDFLRTTSSALRLVFCVSLSITVVLMLLSPFVGIGYVLISSAVFFVIEQQLPERRKEVEKEAMTKQLRETVILTPLAMEQRFVITKWRDDEPVVVVECTAQNASARRVSTFSGKLRAFDLQGELITSQEVVHVLSLGPRQRATLEVKWPGDPRYSDLATVSYENVKWEWEPKKVVFEDGTVLGQAEDDE